MVAVRFFFATAFHNQAAACWLSRAVPGPAFKYFSAVLSSSEPLCHAALAGGPAAAGIVGADGLLVDLPVLTFPLLSAVVSACLGFCDGGAALFDEGLFGGELFSEFCGADASCCGLTGAAAWDWSDEVGTACGRAAGALPLLQKVVLLRHVTYTSKARRIATAAPR